MSGTPGDALSWATIGRLVVTGAGVWIVVQTWQMWLLLITALIVAAAVLPAARWADRYRIPRVLTVLGVYLGAALVLAVLGRFLAPALAEQGAEFGRKLPVYVENVKAWIGQLVAWSARWELPLPAAPGLGEDGLAGLGRVLLANTFRATAGVVGAVIGLVLILVLAAYLVIDAESIGRTLRGLLPARQQARAAALAEPVLNVIGAYVRGQIAVSLSVGAIIAVGLALLGVPYWLLIGGLAAALNVIPFLGSPAAAVLGVLAAFNLSGTLAIWTVLLFWGANLVEGKLLVPYFVGRATGLHPVAVLLGILAGAQLAGFVGAIVAIPVLAGAWEILQRVRTEPGEAVSPGRAAVRQ